MEIPADFDPGRDLIVVAGEGATEVAQQVWGRGYDRVVALEVPDPGELAARLAPYADDPPTRAMVISRDERIAHAIREAVQRKLRGWARNAMTKGTLGDEVKANTAINLRDDRWESVAAGNGKLAGFPLISVMPGPSLDRNIHDLAGARNCAVVLSAIQATRPLHKAGIEPDGVIVLDPGAHLDQYLPGGITYDFAVCSMAVDRGTLYKLQARRWFACSLFPDPSSPFPILASAGNTATAVFSLAITWGCNPIILVGHDFAYAGEQTYAKGYELPGGLTERYDSSEVEVPGLLAGTVRTSQFYDDCRRWMEEAIELCPDRRVINCTEGGAMISGCEVMPLAAAIRAIAAG